MTSSIQSNTNNPVNPLLSSSNPSKKDSLSSSKNQGPAKDFSLRNQALNKRGVSLVGINEAPKTLKPNATVHSDFGSIRAPAKGQINFTFVKQVPDNQTPNSKTKIDAQITLKGLESLADFDGTEIKLSISDLKLGFTEYQALAANPNNEKPALTETQFNNLKSELGINNTGFQEAGKAMLENIRALKNPPKPKLQLVHKFTTMLFGSKSQLNKFESNKDNKSNLTKITDLKTIIKAHLDAAQPFQGINPSASRALESEQERSEEGVPTIKPMQGATLETIVEEDEEPSGQDLTSAEGPKLRHSNVTDPAQPNGDKPFNVTSDEKLESKRAEPDGNKEFEVDPSEQLSRKSLEPEGEAPVDVGEDEGLARASQHESLKQPPGADTNLTSDTEGPKAKVEVEDQKRLDP
jgi:hypothetical protein